MTAPILGRHYLLRDGSRRILVEYTPAPFRQKFQTLHIFSKAEQKKILTGTLPHLSKRVLQDPLLSEFWAHASQELRNDLAFSYYYHEHHRNKKVLNVQTQNWEEMVYFSDSLTSLITQRSVLLHPKKSLKALSRTSGKHLKNLRYNHIHLAFDKVNEEKIHQIHWDIQPPNGPRHSLKHFFFDDIWG